MRIERDDDGGAARFGRVVRRSRDHGLVAEVNAVKNADGEEEGTVEGGEIRYGVEHFHPIDD